MKNSILKFSVLILCLLSIVTANAKKNYDFQVDGIYYKRISSNEVSVVNKESPISYVSCYQGDIEIPESVEYDKEYTVKSIGDSAFYFCIRVTKISIPHSVTSIGQAAFGLCTSLTDITMEI